MKPRIVFFGTGPVSLYSLQGIFDVFEIEAVITKPDRVSPSGKIHDHPVKTFAGEQGLPVFQVENKDELATLVAQEAFTATTGLVVDFGMIIPESVINSFEHGIVNSHFSLLPHLRGADPITFAILEGMRETGVTLMKIVPELDAGDIITQATYMMPPDVTAPALTVELGDISNTLLRTYLPKYMAGKMKLTPQDHSQATFTRKLTKADGVIDWSKPTIQLEREIRAFIPWPGSHTELHGRAVTITAAHIDDDALVIDRVKPAGKREMSLADFERGFQKN